MKNIETINKLLQDAEKQYLSWGKIKMITFLEKINNTWFEYTFSKNDESSFAERKIATQYAWLKHSSLRKAQFVMITKQQYASQITTEIPPILDDQAQILGVSVRYVDIEKVGNGLYARNVCILKDGTSIIKSNTLEDAVVCAYLLEKTAQCYLRSATIGKPKSINRIEAWLMMKFYQLKYSKTNQ